MVYTHENNAAKKTTLSDLLGPPKLHPFRAYKKIDGFAMCDDQMLTLAVDLPLKSDLYDPCRYR